MIPLTRLDGRELVVNADLILLVERTPDTLITFTNGVHLMVKEPIEEVTARAIAFRQRVFAGFTPPAAEG